MQNKLKSRFIIYNPDLKAFFTGTSGKWAYNHRDAIIYNSINEANLARLAIHELYQDYNIGFLIYEFFNEIEHIVRFVHDDLAGSKESIISITTAMVKRARESVKEAREIRERKFNEYDPRSRKEILLSNINTDEKI